MLKTDFFSVFSCKVYFYLLTLSLQKNELCRTIRLGNSSNFTKIPRQALAANGGPQFLREMLSTADYKGGKGTQILSYGVCTYLKVRHLYNLPSSI